MTEKYEAQLKHVVCKVLSLLEACFDLISGSSLSMKIQIMGGKITENLGFKSPLRKVKKNLFFFLFIFKFFTHNWISFILTTFWYLVELIRYQIKDVENLCFYWYLICKTRYSKMVKSKNMQFFMENLKMKKKDKFFLTFRSVDLNPRFSVIFPPMIWIFMESEKIKSKQASKRDRTLLATLE